MLDFLDNGLDELEPTAEELVNGMEDIENWNLMVCVNCHKPFDLLEAITSDGCKCPNCEKYHGEFI